MIEILFSTPVLLTIFFQCKCIGSEDIKIVDGPGCGEGGFGDCPNDFELHCKDGTHVSPNKYMEWRLKGRQGTGCPCTDSTMPTCKSTGKTMKCPNGDEVDWFNTRGKLEKELAEDVKECKLE